MNRKKAPFRKQKRRISGADESNGGAVLQSQNKTGSAHGIEWSEWWQKAATEAMGHQREAVEWWGRFARCWFDCECAPRKLQLLMQQLASAWSGASQAGAQLAVEQQRQVAVLSQAAQQMVQGKSPADARAAALGLWSAWADMARGWGMIPVTNHARTAGAWAEFWSLPSAEGPVD